MKKKILSLTLCVSLVIGMLTGFTGNAASSESEVKGSSVSDWGAHNYIAGDGETVVETTLTANADGGIQVSGNQVMSGLGVGVTNTTPLYLDQGGFSIEFSLDEWDTTSSDKWFGLAIMDAGILMKR